LVEPGVEPLRPSARSSDARDRAGRRALLRRAAPDGRATERAPRRHPPDRRDLPATRAATPKDRAQPRLAAFPAPGCDAPWGPDAGEPARRPNGPDARAGLARRASTCPAARGPPPTAP